MRIGTTLYCGQGSHTRDLEGFLSQYIGQAEQSVGQPHHLYVSLVALQTDVNKFVLACHKIIASRRAVTSTASHDMMKTVTVIFVPSSYCTIKP